MSDERVIRRPGVRFIRELRADEEWIVLSDGRLLIVHPDRELVVIDHDGLEWTPDAAEEIEVIVPGTPRAYVL